jgi:hypothetical protein
MNISNAGKAYDEQIIPILENLLRYCVVTSQELLITPNNGSEAMRYLYGETSEQKFVY